MKDDAKMMFCACVIYLGQALLQGSREWMCSEFAQPPLPLVVAIMIFMSDFTIIM